MAAFGTKKRYGDEAVQLTFPLNFQKAYSGGTAYYPSSMGEQLDVMVGQHFQSQYHEEKRMDANRSVMNGLQARRSMEMKLLTGPHNYHVPKPVLGQRKFANPMNGVVGFPSARRDHAAAPFSVVENSGAMTGGVVSTREGQEFYQLQLQRRIEQLNRMNALAQGFAVPMGQNVNTFANEAFGTKDKVNFFLYLRVLSDSILEADYSRFSFENLKEMMDMLFKFAPNSATEDDFKEMVAGWSEMLDSMRQREEDPFAVGEVGVEKQEYEETLKVFLEKGFQYIREMAANVFRDRRDKAALSSSLIKSLGFTKFLRQRRTEGVVREDARENQRVAQAWENMDGRHGGDGPDDDGDGDGRFDRPAVGREDGEAGGVPRGAMAGRNGDPNRERFGDRNGFFVFGGPAAFFGEQGVGEDEQPLAFPLDLAGVDPSAQAPSADVSTLKEAVQTDLEEQLIALGWRTGADVEGFFTSLGDGDGGDETQKRLVDETAQSLERKGFTKAQIAEGMKQLGYSFFADYIGSNAGDLRPAAAEPARRFNLAPTSLPFVPNVGRTALDPSASEFRSLKAMGLPSSREELLAMSTEQLKAVGEKIPKEFGGPYKPRADSKRASVRTRLISLLRNILPTF